ncbi:unnamed protein product [Rotaria sp. Silwood2]|nr:unnamed protein product [Rotaria sp. Silwood2]
MSSKRRTAAELSSLHSYRTDLSRACSLLTKHPILIEKLLALHPQFDLRRYFLLEQSCRAYFTYLQLSNTNTYGNLNEKKSNNNDDASNVLVTLRLLRVLVRHPQQLRTIFETNLVNVPTVAWKRLIPQLFSRLNHPDSFVRDYVTNLLIRIAKDYPQLILYSVIVGITDDSKMRRIKSRDENIYQRKSSSTHESDDERSQNDIENDDDNDDDDDEEEEDNNEDVEEDDDIEKQENVVAMQNSFRLIYNVLSETNAHVVGQVKLFVHELRRVTVLWDELWLGTMAQLQEEISRRVDVLKDELHRLESMTHLTKEEKEFLIKEKQDVLFKSFITVLEAVSQITRSPAETPREQTFQKDYSKQIDAAIEQLKQPITLSNPHSCWLQLRQLYSMLHRTGKRSGTIHAMSQISPKLAQIKHSAIPIPGEDGQFHTIHSVGQTVQVLPTKTRPKKLMFVGSNGHRYQYLLKGLEDLHLDERIMQLLSIINVMFNKINRNEPWSYEARNYTVIPLASRSGLIQWVEGATPLFSLYKRWQQRQATAQTWKAQNENQEITLATVQKPNDVYYSKLNAILKEKGKQPVEDRREIPMPILRQCIEELIRETPADLLSRELWCSCPSVGLWYKNVQNYSRSLAVTSMIGYMIGLGDRHLDNVLVDLKTMKNIDACISELQIFINQSSTDITTYKNLLDTQLQNLDNNEYTNYRNTLLLMLFDRWQHCRQMSDTARNIFNLSSLTDTNNETFINETYTLISNTAYLALIVQQNSITMSSNSSLIDSTVKLISSLENIFRLLKNLLNNFESTTIPCLIRGACSKQNSLLLCMDLLNNAFKQIQPMTTSNSTTAVDDTCQTVYQQLRSSWATTSNEIFDTFLNLSNSLDDLDKELNNIYTSFQTLSIPSVWLQSSLFDWKQTNIDNDVHRQFLTNFFAMSKIATMQQVCQLIVDHSQTFDNLKLQITKDNDLSDIIRQFIILYIVQYLVDLPSLATSYLMLSLIPSSQSILENNLIQTENQFQDYINNLCIITATNQIADLQKIFLQINGIWQNDNTAEHIKTSLDILQMRKHTNEMQLIAYRWKNFYLLNSNNKNQQRQTICEELTTDQSILTINDSISTMIIDKMTSLEQTVIQRLRWAAGANPLVQDVLDKFEMRQKERANEIDNDKQLCLHLVKILQSWLLFEQYEEQIKLQRDLIIHARTFAEKGLEICQLKHDIESNFTIVEQAILEFPPVENLKQITLQNLPSLIEQAENECMKHKRNRIKEERELENRRDETSHLISELKEHMSQHNTIFKDISSVLKSLLKIIPHRALQNYSNIHREFLELCHNIVKHTLHIDTTSSMKYDVLITKMKRIITIKTKVFDDLIQLNPTIDNENRERTSSSTVNISTQHETTDKTTKVTEERNKYAVEICKRIRDKLDGSDPDPLTQSSISEQVRYTIREATDIENLATLYEGWTSWV